jgi:hypothetical protein
MDIEEARELLRRSENDRAEARTQVMNAQATLDSSRLIIQGILRRYPDLADEEITLDVAWADEPDKPRGAEAVLQILQVDENQWFSVKGLVRELEDRGWLPDSPNPANAVRAALERLVGTHASGVKKARDNEDVVVYSYEEPPKRGYGFDEEPF